jgi:hypothetical protein
LSAFSNGTVHVVAPRENAVGLAIVLRDEDHDLGAGAAAIIEPNFRLDAAAGFVLALANAPADTRRRKMAWPSVGFRFRCTRTCWELIHPAIGARLVFLPKYSPDLNPIEQVFAKFKTLLRKAEARTYDAVANASAAILAQYPPEECAAYVKNAGYA